MAFSDRKLAIMRCLGLVGVRAAKNACAGVTPTLEPAIAPLVRRQPAKILDVSSGEAVQDVFIDIVVLIGEFGAFTHFSFKLHAVVGASPRLHRCFAHGFTETFGVVRLGINPAPVVFIEADFSVVFAVVDTVFAAKTGRLVTPDGAARWRRGRCGA